MSFDVDILGIFWLGDFFGYFLKNWAFSFFKSSGHSEQHMPIPMGLNHPLDGITNLKFKLLYFLTTNKKSKRLALAFYRDRCWHLELCLWLILFH
jgi:hypothetical protein